MNPVTTDLEALAQSSHTRVCPLYLQDGPRAILVGTGVPFSTGTARYIVTASHVLERLSDRPLMTIGTKSLVRLPLRSLAYEYIRGRTVDVDVGIIHLQPEIALEISSIFRFSTMDEWGHVTEYSKTTLYMFIGYPYSRNRPTPPSPTEFRATPTFLILREFANALQFSSGKRPREHFALSAPRKELKGFSGKPLGMPILKGMSGGGVWRVDLNQQDGTVASVSLVGIGIEHCAQASALIATRIQCIMDLLTQQ